MVEAREAAGLVAEGSEAGWAAAGLVEEAMAAVDLGAED